MGPGFVEGLTVDRFHGVGPATAAKMNRLGIFTALDLRAKNEDFLRTHFGKAGPHYFNICRGWIPTRSAMHRVLGLTRDMTSSFAAFRWISGMRRRLRGKENREGSKRSGVALRVGIQGGIDHRPVCANRVRKSVGAENTFPLPLSDRSALATISADLLAAQFPMPKHVRLIGVSLSSLCDDLREDEPQITLAL